MKNMKTKMMAAVVAMLITGSAFAQSDQQGNGGGAVVCRDKAGKITSAQLFDLYEGERLLGMKFVKSEGTMEDMMLKTVDRFRDTQGHYLREIDNEASKILTSIDQNTNYVKFTADPLPLVADIYNITVPKNCAIEQAAIRTTKEQMKAYKGIAYVINQEIWNAFDSLNRYALVIHEPVYKLSEKSNSLLSRAVVRELFREDMSFIDTTIAIIENGFYSVIPTNGPMYYSIKYPTEYRLDRDVLILRTPQGIEIAYNDEGKIVYERCPKIRYEIYASVQYPQRFTQLLIDTPHETINPLATYTQGFNCYGFTIELKAFDKIIIRAVKNELSEPFYNFTIDNQGINTNLLKDFSGTIVDLFFPDLKK